MATVTIFCTDGCFSTCLSYNAANDIEREKLLSKKKFEQPTI